jgi:hypothetical protein
MPRPENGWVGWWNGSSCVPVGKHWFISARHVGGSAGQAVWMRGVAYTVLEVRQHPTFDIQLLRVAEELPGFHKLAPGAGVGDPVLLAGYGVTAGAVLPQGGYDWTGERRETWGANVIEGEGSLLAVRFDAPTAAASVPFESVFAVNDSGGGLFTIAQDGSLELAGVAVSVLSFGSSPYNAVAFSLNVDLFRAWAQPVVNPDVPISSGIAAPRAMIGGPGAAGTLAGVALLGALASLRRRR